MSHKKPFFILGPCVIENEEMVWEIAEELFEISKRLEINFVFKASFKKANRTSLSSYQGMSADKGCKILYEIKKHFNISVTTDVHDVEDVKVASKYVDIIQIPAFLCRQTELIKLAAESGKTVSVKKGQFLAPWDVKNIAEKLEANNCSDYFFIERGSTFGYGNLVVDMRSLYWIQKMGYRIVFDATHSVQKPSTGSGVTEGDRDLAPVLARSAVATGCCDGVFFETHANPKDALSDAANQVPLNQIENILKKILDIYKVVGYCDQLNN